ncbi:MAG: ABC transporter permease [Pseudomonadota bacterium]
MSALVAFVVVVPILTVAASLVAGPGEALRHVIETRLADVLRNTVLMALFVGGGAALIGVATAWLVARCRFPGARQFAWLLVLPLAMPAFIIGYAYTDALAFAGPLQTALRDTFGWGRDDYWFPDVHSVGGVSLMLVLVLYPYVYLTTRVAFAEPSQQALDVARSLGQGPWRVFWHVALPLARPAIVAGTVLVLMEALADFATVQYFGIHTFTTTIYRTWFGMGDRIAAAQLASGLLVVVLLLVWLERSARGRRRFHRRSAGTAPAAHQLHGWRAGLAFLACALPVTLGFLLPVALLVRLHLRGGDALLGGAFWDYAGNSLILAVLASVLVVLVAVLLAYALRWAETPLVRPLVRLASIGYAIPGTVVAVGLLVPLAAIDHAVDGWMRQAFGINTGLVLSGTMVALLYAYLVRFLAIAQQGIEAGFAGIPTSMDDAARLLGTRGFGIVARVHVPLLRRSLWTAALIVFVDVIKELPATLIIRPFDFDTLAIRVYQLASDERLSEAATGSLAIVLVGLLPVLVVTRLTRLRAAPTNLPAVAPTARAGAD